MKQVVSDSDNRKGNEIITKINCDHSKHFRNWQHCTHKHNENASLLNPKKEEILRVFVRTYIFIFMEKAEYFMRSRAVRWYANKASQMRERERRDDEMCRLGKRRWLRRRPFFFCSVVKASSHLFVRREKEKMLNCSHFYCFCNSIWVRKRF